MKDFREEEEIRPLGRPRQRQSGEIQRVDGPADFGKAHGAAKRIQLIAARGADHERMNNTIIFKSV